MKKQLSGFLLTLLAHQAFAVYTGPQVRTPYADVNYGNATRSSYGAGVNLWGNQFNDSNPIQENRFQGSWEFDEGLINTTTGSGRAEFALSQFQTTTLYYNHDVSGYIAGLYQNSSFPGAVNVIFDKGKTMTSSGRSIFIADRHGNNNNMGIWNITGGTFFAGNDSEGLRARTVTSVTLDSTSFTAGSGGRSAVFIDSGILNISNTQERNDILFKAADITSAGNYGSIISNPDNEVTTNDKLNNGAGGSGIKASSATISGGGGSFIGSQVLTRDRRNVVLVEDNVTLRRAAAEGGHGAIITGAATLNGGTYRFQAGDAGNATVSGNNSLAHAFGGYGASFGSGNGTVSNSTFNAGSAGTAEVVDARYMVDEDTIVETSSNARAYAHGGSGLKTGTGTLTLINTDARGGNGGSAIANDTGGYADASGGNGVYTTGNLTIDGGTYQGRNGGIAVAALGEAYAFGGSGIWANGSGTIDILDGTFNSGKGGTANGAGNADGAGVKVSGGTLNIYGGTFNGAGQMNNGIWAENTTLTMTNGTVNGNVRLDGNDNKNATFSGGMIGGDIIKDGSGTTTLSISSNAKYTGSYKQYDGNTSVTLTTPEESKFFSKVNIMQGNLDFTDAMMETADGAVFDLGDAGTILTFAQGAELSNGSIINAGLSTVSATTGNLELGENSSISLSYAPTFDTNGVLVSNLDGGGITGNLVLSNTTATIKANGRSALSSGSVQLTTGGVAASTNLEVFVDANFGWLTAVTNIVDSGGILAQFDYNSLTNTSLTDLNESLLLYVDSVILGLDTNAFYTLNSGSEGEGTQLFRYSLSQLPDVSESSFQVSQQINKQIAARGSEFRSMNGFASTQPNFAEQTRPTGVAGPSTEDTSMQGWIRAFGSFGDKDQTDKFSSYDSTSWGSVIGVDKSFGNLLIGVAGGYTRTDLDAGAAYNADVDTYHGSIYSTLGGETIFIDLAATYGAAKTKESNAASSGKFDSDIYSFYAGAGKKFDINEKWTLTPEASLLHSFYDQESFNRSGILGTATVKEYDTTSTLSSLGINFATQHQIDWLNRGLAFIPELRAHWLHEFNPDPDNFIYTIGGISSPSAVRPRDEDLLRLGVGFDIWNWKYQSTKFEVDYDGLLSDTYREHIFSGKITLQF